MQSSKPRIELTQSSTTKVSIGSGGGHRSTYSISITDSLSFQIEV